jgi:hydrogenase/urease accessory protein HupE
MKPTRLHSSALLWLLTSVQAMAHHVPPELEEVDEFGHETLRSQMLHPFTGVDHWLVSLGLGSLLFLGIYHLRSRRQARLAKTIH